MTALRLVDGAEGATFTVLAVCEQSPARASRLAAMGIVAGIEITLVQRRPAFLLAYETSLLAIDREIAEQVLVEPAEPPGR
jgi:Fe2+ transport system protein FeoA